jgi:hypothetical protein
MTFDGIAVWTVSFNALFDVVFDAVFAVFDGSPVSAATGEVFVGVAGVGAFLSGPGRGILILICADISPVETNQKKVATMINRKLLRDRCFMRILL